MLLTLYRIRRDALTVSGVTGPQSRDAARDVQTQAAHLTPPAEAIRVSFPLYPVAGSLDNRAIVAIRQSLNGETRYAQVGS
jgi:hypothetical protein